jgi:hypothetical protein
MHCLLLLDWAVAPWNGLGLLWLLGTLRLVVNGGAEALQAAASGTFAPIRGGPIGHFLQQAGAFAGRLGGPVAAPVFAVVS